MYLHFFFSFDRENFIYFIVITEYEPEVIHLIFFLFSHQLGASSMPSCNQICQAKRYTKTTNLFLSLSIFVVNLKHSE